MRDSAKPLSMAIIGTRGIPASYGGFETFAEQLGVRLAEKGHLVTIYGRKPYCRGLGPDSTYKGVKVRLLPILPHKYLETPVHALLSLVDSVFRKYDLVVVCNAANSPFMLLTKVFRKRSAINVDGIERLRAKWNRLGRLWYRFGEFCATKFADVVISDAEVIARYYRSEYGRDSTVISYGCDRSEDNRVQSKLIDQSLVWFSPKEKGLFTELGVQPFKYLLYVSRFEPENNALLVVRAYNSFRKHVGSAAPKLVMVGDAPYADSYKAQVMNEAGEGVCFSGYRFGDDYRTLQLGAWVYVQATEVGGTHPALVEGMGFGNCVVAHKTDENLEVLAEAGLYFERGSAQSLNEVLQELFVRKEAVLSYRKLAVQRAHTTYDWSRVASAYEELLRESA